MIVIVISLIFTLQKSGNEPFQNLRLVPICKKRIAVTSYFLDKIRFERFKDALDGNNPCAKDPALRCPLGDSGTK